MKYSGIISRPAGSGQLFRVLTLQSRQLIRGIEHLLLDTCAGVQLRERQATFRLFHRAFRAFVPIRHGVAHRPAVGSHQHKIHGPGVYTHGFGNLIYSLARAQSLQNALPQLFRIPAVMPVFPAPECYRSGRSPPASCSLSPHGPEYGARRMRRCRWQDDISHDPSCSFCPVRVFRHGYLPCSSFIILHRRKQNKDAVFKITASFFRIFMLHFLFSTILTGIPWGFCHTAAGTHGGNELVLSYPTAAQTSCMVSRVSRSRRAALSSRLCGRSS